MDKINKDIDICSTSGAKNQKILNLIPNPLNEEDSYSLGVSFKEPIGPIQLPKTQIFLNTNKPCVRRGNKTCDQTQVCEASEVREKKEMIENKVENSGEKISNINLKIVNEKSFGLAKLRNLYRTS